MGDTNFRKILIKSHKRKQSCIGNTEGGEPMRRFYKQIRLDKNLKRFYVGCAVCGERLYATKLPLICRNKNRFDLLEQGQGSWLEQQGFNHTKAVSVRYLSRFYNQCPHCGSWICDTCYNIVEEKGCFYCNKL